MDTNDSGEGTGLSCFRESKDSRLLRNAFTKLNGIIPPNSVHHEHIARRNSSRDVRVQCGFIFKHCMLLTVKYLDVLPNVPRWMFLIFSGASHGELSGYLVGLNT
jgi:hypothetical protein